MSSKTLLFVALFLLLQGFGNAIEEIPDPTDETDSQDVVDNIESSAVDNCSKNRVEEVRAELAKLLADRRAEIEAAIQTKLNSNAKYVECLQKNKDAITALANANIENIKACADGKLVNIKQMIAKVKESINNLKNYRKTTNEELKKCQDDACKKTIMDAFKISFKQQLKGISAEIKSILKEAVIIYTGISSCNLKNKLQITSDAKKIVEEVRKCAQQPI